MSCHPPSAESSTARISCHGVTPGSTVPLSRHRFAPESSTVPLSRHGLIPESSTIRVLRQFRPGRGTKWRPWRVFGGIHKEQVEVMPVQSLAAFLRPSENPPRSAFCATRSQIHPHPWFRATGSPPDPRCRFQATGQQNALPKSIGGASSVD